MCKRPICVKTEDCEIISVCLDKSSISYEKALHLPRDHHAVLVPVARRLGELDTEPSLARILATLHTPNKDDKDDTFANKVCRR